MLPPAVREAVEATLATREGRSMRLAGSEPVGGGCVSAVARIGTSAGGTYFLKWSDGSQPAGLLTAEARGLERLADARAVRVPDVIALGDASGFEWLLTEWLEPGVGSDRAWAELGTRLAALHRCRADSFGAEEDNFIGPLPQSNRPSGAWAEFWWARRLEPQIRRAVDAGRLDGRIRSRVDGLRARLPDLLADGDEEGPSLLHGDLWSGNVHMLATGGAALIDPSVYYGHREVDLAMAELFGGFGSGFRLAYEEAWPLASGYAPARRAVYQLYYLLVHVNLFGAGYVAGTTRALTEAGV